MESKDCAESLRRMHREWQEASKERKYRRLRRLLLLALLSLYEPRVDALRMLDIDDYLPDHLTSDGVRGPVLRLYPGKTGAHDEPHIPPLPDELAAWIEAWISYTGRSIDDSDQPFWPNRKPKTSQPVERISSSGLYGAIAGREDTDGPGNSLPLLPRGANEYHGYNSHAYRHTAYQAAKRAAVQAKQARRQKFAHVDAEDFARAICAHDFNQSVSDAYRDLHQQQLAHAVVGYAWRDLWSDGKRHGLDMRSQHEVETLNAAVDHLDRELRTLHARQSNLSRGTGKLAGDDLHAA